MISAAFLLAVQAATASAPYPADAVLSAFREACSSLGDIQEARAAADAAGWQSVEVRPGHPLFEIREIDRQLGSRTQHADFIRTVSDRSLYLHLSHRQEGEIREHHCRVHDFDAQAPVERAAAEQWAGESAWWSHGLSRAGNHNTRFGSLFEGHGNTDVSFTTRAWAEANGIPAMRGVTMQTWWTNAPPAPVVY